MHSPASAAAPEAFVGAIEKIVQLCDIRAERIRGLLADGKAPATDAPDTSTSLLLNS